MSAVGTQGTKTPSCTTCVGTRLAPPTRLLAAANIVLIVLVCNPLRPWGLVFALTAVLGGVLALRPTRRVWRLAATIGGMFFLPWVAVATLLPRFQQGAGTASNLELTATIAFRGIAIILTTLSLATRLTQSELRDGLRRLAMPTIVVAITTQIIQQSVHLVEETQRMKDAIVLRKRKGNRMADVLLIRGLPVIWLHRVLHRVERVAQAMELRGYTGEEAPLDAGAALRLPDYTAVGILLILLTVALALRYQGLV